jgi:hypothetical protein
MASARGCAEFIVRTLPWIKTKSAIVRGISTSTDKASLKLKRVLLTFYVLKCDCSHRLRGLGIRLSIITSAAMQLQHPDRDLEPGTKRQNIKIHISNYN